MPIFRDNSENPVKIRMKILSKTVELDKNLPLLLVHHCKQIDMKSIPKKAYHTKTNWKFNGKNIDSFIETFFEKSLTKLLLKLF